MTNFNEEPIKQAKHRRRSVLSTISTPNDSNQKHSKQTSNHWNQCFTLILVVFVSILINVFYFQFIYLPNNNIIAKQKLFNHINYDHVVFPPMIDHNTRHKAEETNSDEDLISNIYQIDYDSDENVKQNELDKKREAHMAVNLALSMQNEGKIDKAAKIYKYALSLDPNNIEALTFYGEYLELHKKDVIKAEHFYSKVLTKEPSNDKALLNLRRTLPLVNKLDRIMLDQLDLLLKEFYKIPLSSSALRRAKRESYFMHIYQ